MLNDFYYSNPIWLDALLVIGVCVGLSLAGLAVFNRLVPAHKREEDNEAVGLTYAIVAVLFAVLAALVTVDVWESAARAGELATGEANQLSSLVLDAPGLDPAVAEHIRAGVESYIEIVVKKEWPAQRAGKADDKAYETGWVEVGKISTELAAYEPQTMGQNATKAEMLHTVNQLINARQVRILAAADHLPDVTWLMLILAGAVSIFYVYLFGAHSFWIHLTFTGLIAAMIALVFVLIIALDFPFRGELSVRPEAFERVMATAGATGPPAEAPAATNAAAGEAPDAPANATPAAAAPANAADDAQ
ncbi:MAG TPA: DUF4239 domain-containing protein [Caulobacteraceae bacterium]|jgi:hypothetical protein|nr:DUF4239 domain-containing protein [Caulobacteraceae bacterium]